MRHTSASKGNGLGAIAVAEKMPERELTRRQYLLAAGASGVMGLSGCSGGGDGGTGEDGNEDTTDDDEMETNRGENGDTTEAERSGDGSDGFTPWISEYASPTGPRSPPVWTSGSVRLPNGSLSWPSQSLSPVAEPSTGSNSPRWMPFRTGSCSASLGGGAVTSSASSRSSSSTRILRAVSASTTTISPGETR